MNHTTPTKAPHDCAYGACQRHAVRLYSPPEGEGRYMCPEHAERLQLSFGGTVTVDAA